MNGRDIIGKPENDIIAKLRRMPTLLTVREAAKVTHKHPETLYKMIHEKRIPAFLDGARWKIDPGKIGDWLERRSTEVKPAPPPTPEKDAPKPLGGGEHNGAPASASDGKSEFSSNTY